MNINCLLVSNGLILHLLEPSGCQTLPPNLLSILENPVPRNNNNKKRIFFIMGFLNINCKSSRTLLSIKFALLLPSLPLLIWENSLSSLLCFAALTVKELAPSFPSSLLEIPLLASTSHISLASLYYDTGQISPHAILIERVKCEMRGCHRTISKVPFSSHILYVSRMIQRNWNNSI